MKLATGTPLRVSSGRGIPAVESNPWCLALLELAAVVLVLLVYSYPSLRTRNELGPSPLPSIFAPDLSLYLNLSNATATGEGNVLNPYYRVVVPANGSGYLKFGLGANLFGGFNRLSGNRTWLTLFVWNLFWWGLICAVARWLFRNFLPRSVPGFAIAGLLLLTLANFGVLKTQLHAWLHLPSLAGFESVGLPYMRSFIPQIPTVLLLAYLGLQMDVLRRRRIADWLLMGGLQLLALAVFPYATLVMAGISAISLLWTLISRDGWLSALVYGFACGIVDGIFLLRGSLSFYSGHSSPIHFQPKLLPGLIGGAWLLLCLLTTLAATCKGLSGEVKWPLVGLGAISLILMLGDVLIPATTILLSHHAAHFVHTTTAILTIFVVSAGLMRAQPAGRAQTAVLVAAAILMANGVLLSVATYTASLSENRDQAKMARLFVAWKPAKGDLMVARSRDVDDQCGWIALLAAQPLLFCTDAEVLLTPEQNRQIHRFRQALYLYFSGKGSEDLHRIMSDSHPLSQMYQLGYWAEATSLSIEEQHEGLRAIENELIPPLRRVEQHDASASAFLRQFKRIVVIDNWENPTFSQERLSSFMKINAETRFEGSTLLFCTPR